MAATLGCFELAGFRLCGAPLAAPGIRSLAWYWRSAAPPSASTGRSSSSPYHPFSLPVYTYNQFSGGGLAHPPLRPQPLAFAVAAVVDRPLAAPPRNVVAGRTRLVPAAQPPSKRAAERPPRKVTFDIDYRGGELSIGRGVTPLRREARLAVLGPSGSGKTVAPAQPGWLEGPSRRVAGPVERLDGPVERLWRSMSRGQWATRPSASSLFPHLTVWEQLLFAERAPPRSALTLRIGSRRLPPRGDCHKLIPRPALRWGQRQRVALGTGLVPIAGSFAVGRALLGARRAGPRELRRELRRLQHDTGLATVLVTHDPGEAACWQTR